ncbi:MAG: hypothetical protein ABJO27_06150 [Pseudoruegeria sp.]
MSRIARAYLDTLYDEGDGKSHVWVVPGRLTEMLRRHWELNGLSALTDCHTQTVKAKNRTDHRHHAIDAAVVAARFVPPPRDGFRDDNEVAVCIPFALMTAAQLRVGGRSGWIRDPQLRHALTVATKNKEGKAFESTFINFAAKEGLYKGLRRVRT